MFADCNCAMKLRVQQLAEGGKDRSGSGGSCYGVSKEGRRRR